MLDQLVSLETAMLAKEKTFNEICYYFYNDTMHKEAMEDCKFHSNKQFEEKYSSDYITAPTQSLLHRWLREKHNLWVEITLWGDGIGTMCAIKKADLNDKEEDGSRIVRLEKNVDTGQITRLEFSYEKTLEIGLQEALKLLK